MYRISKGAIVGFFFGLVAVVCLPYAVAIAGSAIQAPPGPVFNNGRARNIPDPVAFGTANYWILSEVPFTTNAQNTPGRGALRCRPLITGQLRTITALAIVVAAGQAGALGRYGVYSVDVTGYPASLVVDSGELDLSTSGRKTTTGLSIAVNASTRYCFAWLGGGAGTLPTIIVNSTASYPYALSVVAAATTIAVASTEGWGWSVAYAYNVLPTTYPPGATSSAASRDAFPYPLLQGTSQ